MTTAAYIENIVCMVCATVVLLFAPGLWKLAGILLLGFMNYSRPKSAP